MAVYQNLGTGWSNVDSTPHTEQETAIERLANGGYVVAWIDGNGGDNNVRCQIFGASGAPVCGEFIVNAPTPQGSYEVKSGVDIQLLADGNFAVSWEQASAGANGHGPGILARVFAPSGQPLHDEFLAATYDNTFTTGAWSQMVAAGGGDFWMITSTQPANQNYDGLYAQRVSSDGTVLTSRITIDVPPHSNPNAFYDDLDPEAIALSNGNILVSWREYDPDKTIIRAEVFTSSFVPVTSAFTVVTLPANESFPYLAVAPLANGGFAMNWSATTADGISSVQLQRFDASGVGVGSKLILDQNSQNGDASTDVTTLADGRLLVTWTPSTGQEVIGQIVDTNGAVAGSPFPISSTDYQGRVAVTGLSGGGFAATYIGQRSNVDGDTWSVKAQAFALTAKIGTTGDDVIVVQTGHLGAVHGLAGNDQIFGNGDVNMLFGDAGNDILSGGGGSDTVTGGKGVDTLHGDGGDDMFIVATGDGLDVIDGGSGIDTIRAAANNAKISIGTITNVETIDAGGHSGVTIVGTTGGDTLDLSAFALTGITAIDAGAGNDVVIGSNGADIIRATAGADQLTGGLGADIFLFKATGDSKVGFADTITDFAPGTDIIDLSRIDASTKFTGNQAFTFIGSNAFSKVAGELRIDASVPGETLIFADTNGDGKADIEIHLIGVLSLSHADFIL